MCIGANAGGGHHDVPHKGQVRESRVRTLEPQPWLDSAVCSSSMAPAVTLRAHAAERSALVMTAFRQVRRSFRSCSRCASICHWQCQVWFH